MAASARNGQPVRSASAAFANTPGNNASILLEKSRPGVRRSTPDSDALASSDDEVDHHHHTQTQPTPLANQRRRTSWLNEVPSTLMRKASLPATSSFSPVNSNPTTPAADQTSWGTATSPGVATSVNWGNASGSGSFPWGTGIWNAENRKEPPSRMVEVLQSPTSSNPPNMISTSGEDQGNAAAHQGSGDPPIPFAIPLHPTPKTYRSQSYSVGQLDPESSSMPPPPTATSNKPAPPVSRNRPAAPYSSVQRRSSRPSLLELGHDPATLGRVREDDDDISPNGMEPNNNNWASNQARTIEQLTMENAMLRQAASSQAEGPRFRDRTLSSTSANSGYSMAQTHKLHPIQGSVPEESDLAVDDLEDVGGFAGYNNSRSNARRRFSEHSTNLEKQFPTFASLENRTLENIKRAQWQSSLGFGSISDIPQSRRHSFADTLTRHPSSSFPSSSETRASAGSTSSLLTRDEGNFADNGLNASSADIASYAPGQEGIPSSGISTSLHQAYVMPNAFGRQHAALGQPHQNQQLFIVTFKCYRADVFYIQEGTGLEVKAGELVIVEADRGTDLGTVAHANISWAKAKELKDHYAEEHYKWLMLFSRQNQAGGTAINPNGPPSLGGAPGSAVGGMGPQSQHTAQEPQSAEIKPKLIKRLAQNHEIQTLRDKEGNEAKAKRVCQQKVAEHRLNMEILDAEFQMDWKKLTFYYFADSYINFNSLVTDLFKIYKTRIWMSAINPASFVTPSTGLPAPAPGAGLMGYGQDAHADRRRQPDFGQYGASINHGLSPALYPDSSNRDAGQAGMRPPYLDPYQTFGVARQPDTGFGAGIQPQTDPFSSYPPTNYSMMDPNAAEFGRLNAGGHRAHPGQNEWTNQFHSLSLNS
ncbi:PSP1 domain-containing protein [Arthroderma uncinatum]|uniref:PSP1 domain-containing protein n=1 Tax=Arthroderma uncinatum TaxID=74035 RepID=UPI00144A5BCD|nr:PSP1 domain-containing protein [Arthroderma uncinatum]KAF3482902.1 PSP1 domain-containing protein [Arthroderma uncinatum]